jgi:predicted nuclease with TOPRIM domain
VCGIRTLRIAMNRNDLRRKNARLRDQIADVVQNDPELRERDEGMALRQDLHVEVGIPFLERTKGKLQERAGAIIKRNPELEKKFDR